MHAKKKIEGQLC